MKLVIVALLSFRWKKLRDNSIKCPSNYWPASNFSSNIFFFSPSKRSKRIKRPEVHQLLVVVSISFSLSFSVVSWRYKLKRTLLVTTTLTAGINIQFSYHFLIVEDFWWFIEMSVTQNYEKKLLIKPVIIIIKHPSDVLMCVNFVDAFVCWRGSTKKKLFSFSTLPKRKIIHL